MQPTNLLWPRKAPADPLRALTKRLTVDAGARVIIKHAAEPSFACACGAQMVASELSPPALRFAFRARGPAEPTFLRAAPSRDANPVDRNSVPVPGKVFDN